MLNLAAGLPIDAREDWVCDAMQGAVYWGIGEVILNPQRGDGPPGAGKLHIYCPGDHRSADPARARHVVARLFPALEAQLIDQVVQRDVVFYSASITEEAIEQVSQFAQSEGLLSGPVTYDHVVATPRTPGQWCWVQ